MKYIKACSTWTGNQSGYVLPWVIIVMLVAGIIIVPFMSWMLTSLTTAHHRMDTMQEYYAADSGIEDAVHKIQTGYSALTALSEDITPGDTTIHVLRDDIYLGTDLFPERGIIQIEGELIYYTSKEPEAFTINPDAGGTPVSVNHEPGVLVTASMPQDIGEVWEYGIDDVNGNQVDVSIGELWVLEGLEEPKSGKMPHADLVVVGRVVAMTEDYAVFGVQTGCYNPGAFKVNRIGVWLPEGFDYLPGSTTLGTTLASGIIFNWITVVSTDLFPDQGVIAIPYKDDPDSYELISYDSKTGTKFHVLQRGYGNTEVGDHESGASVSNEPTQEPYNGGIALKWDMHPAIDYIDLPPAPQEGDFEMGDEIPLHKAMFFKFTPPEYPTGIFSWVRTNRNDIYLAWDVTSGSYRITSTATDPNTGTHTTVYSYTLRDKPYGLPPVVGDARVIGNSLIIDKDGDGKRETLRRTLVPEDESSAFIDIAHDNDIPDDSTVEAAYLYWSGWKYGPGDYTPSSIDNSKGNINKIEELAHMVDGATLEVEGTAYPIEEADRVQLLESPGGWSFSCFEDVTELLQPDPVANITMYPRSTVDSITILNTGSGEAQIKITGSSGNPDSMWVDGTIEVKPNDTPTNVKILDGSSVVLAAGATTGTYQATIEVKRLGDEVTIDDTPYTKADGERPLPPLDSAQDLPEMTITKLTTNASVDITAFQTPADMKVYDNTGDLECVISPGDTEKDLWLSGANPWYTIKGIADVYEPYKVTIAVTDGKVKVEVAYSGETRILGEPDSQIANGEYILSNVEAYNEDNLADDSDEDEDTYSEDLDKDWSYAGWSLIVIYSHPDAGARHFFLHDTFLFADQDTSQTFIDKGFLAPDSASGSWVACFVGDGDALETGDYIKFQAYTDEVDDDDWRYLPADNPDDDDVFNGLSRTFDGDEIDNDIDIDRFNVNPTWMERDDPLVPLDSVAVKLETQLDSWNLVYLLVALRTEQLAEQGQYPTSITIYTFEGE